MNKYQKAIYQISNRGKSFNAAYKIIKKVYVKALKNCDLEGVIEFKDQRKKQLQMGNYERTRK